MSKSITQASTIKRAITVAHSEAVMIDGFESRMKTASMKTFVAIVPAKAFFKKSDKKGVGAFTDSLESAGLNRRTAQRNLSIAGQFIKEYKLKAGVTESEVSDIIEANGFESVQEIYKAVKPEAKPKLDENGDPVEAVEVPKEAKLLKYAITQSGGDVVKALALLGAAMQLGEKAASALKNEAVA